MVNISSHTLIKSDNICDYIPVISTLSNLTDLFLKYVRIPLANHTLPPFNRSPSPYYKHLKEKHTLRCVTLLTPFIGNVIVLIYDCARKILQTAFNNAKFIESTAAKLPLLMQFANDRLKSAPEFMKKMIKIDPRMIRYASPRLLHDQEFMLTALENYPECLKILALLPPHFLPTHNAEFMLKASEIDPTMINRIDSTLLFNSQFMAKIIKIDPKMLERTSPNLLSDIVFVWEAIKIDPSYLLKAPSLIQEEERGLKIAIRENVRVLEHIKPHFKNNKEFMRSAITAYNREAVKYLGEPLRKDIDYISSLIKDFPETQEWIENPSL